MVVVVRDRGPIAAILLIISILSLVFILVLIFLVSQGRGNIMVIAIPGFPLESMVLGLVLGLFMIVMFRSGRRKIKADDSDSRRSPVTPPPSQKELNQLAIRREPLTVKHNDSCRTEILNFSAAY